MMVDAKIQRSRMVDSVMTAVFYVIAVFFFTLLLGFACKVFPLFHSF